MPVRFRLSELLEAAGLSQRELARRSGVSLTIISRMANNHARQAALGTLERLAKVLQVEPGELIARSSARKKR